MRRIFEACVYRAGKPIRIGDVELDSETVATTSGSVDLSIKVLSLVVSSDASGRSETAAPPGSGLMPRMCVVVEERVR
jgi:hypothetical protein